MNTSRFATSKIVQWLGVGALALAFVVFGGGAWLGHAGPAFAPEPAKLTQGLNGGIGATAAAVYSTSQVPTTVVVWPAVPTSGNNPPTAGAPCSNGPLAYGAVTTKVIQRLGGNSARCV